MNQANRALVDGKHAQHLLQPRPYQSGYWRGLMMRRAQHLLQRPCCVPVSLRPEHLHEVEGQLEAVGDYHRAAFRHCDNVGRECVR